MLTLFLQVFRLVNVVYTATFGLMALYWISVALGFLDIEVLDFDIDDAEVGLGGLLGILNIGDVPFSIWVTIFSAQMSLYSIAFNLFVDQLPFAMGGFVRFAVCGIIFLPLTAVITKFVTQPIKKAFEIKSVKRSSFVGMECRVTSPVVNENSGVGEIRVSGVPNIIYIRAKAEDGFKKDDRALIYEYDETKDMFFVSRV